MKNLFLPLVFLSQIFAIATVVLLAYWTGVTLGGFAWDGSMQHFNWHPLLMVLGMVILNGEGILAFRLFPMISKPKAKVIHMTIQGIIVVMGGVALKAVFAYQNANGWANAHTVHSWVGFVTYLMFALQWVCGFLIFFFPKLPEDNRSAYMPLHRYFGVALFALAIVTVISGIQEEIMFHPPKTNAFNERQAIGDTMGLVIIAFALIIGFLITSPDYKRQCEATDDEKMPLTASPSPIGGSSGITASPSPVGGSSGEHPSSSSSP